MLGPSGMGGLWGKEELLNNMRTIQSGGQTVKTSHYDSVEWAQSPSKFEGGLGHFAGMMATGAAIDYLSQLNMQQVHEHEVRLNRIMSNGVKDLDGISIIGPEDASQRGGICSLCDEKLPAHDIALLLDEVSGVMVHLGSIVSTHGLTAEGTMVRYEHLLIFTTLTRMLSDLLIPSPKL